MTKTIIGDRPLSSMTDEELAVFLDLTGEYGCKEYWGEPIITTIDRDKFDHSITVWFKQIRKSDGVVSDAYLMVDYDQLHYYVNHYYPYQRMTTTRTFMENTKLFLYILSQGFNIMELLPDGITKEPGSSTRSLKAHSYIIADYMYMLHGKYDKADMKFFTNENELDAIHEYEKTKKEPYKHKKLYAVIPIEDLKPKERISEDEPNENNTVANDRTEITPN